MRRTGVIVSLGPLGRGEHNFEFSPSPEDLELDERFSNIIVDVRVIIAGSQVVAIVDSRATILLTCDRTLKEFSRELSGSSSVLGSAVDSTESDRYDDVVEISAVDQTLNLSNIVRDTLFLAVPRRAVAPGEEDSQIRTVFTDKDEEWTDPRWAGLKKLRNKG